MFNECIFTINFFSPAMLCSNEAYHPATSVDQVQLQVVSLIQYANRNSKCNPMCFCTFPLYGQCKKLT